MVRLIVQHHGSLATEKTLADAADDIALGFQGGDRAVAATDDFAGERRHLGGFARLEGVEIDDPYPRLLQPVAHVQRHDVVQLVGVVRIGREQHPQPVYFVGRRDLGQPDRGFGGFDLAEEQAARAVFRAPMLYQASRYRRYPRMARPGAGHDGRELLRLLDR